MIRLMVVLLLAVAGCSAAPGTASEPPARELTSAELRTLDQAQKVLEGRCMQRQGIPFWVLPAPDPDDQRRFPYVIDDVGWARKEGYGALHRRRVEESRRTDPNRRYFRSLPPEQRAKVLAALNGERPEGLSATLPTGQTIEASDRSCVAEAQRELYGDLTGWFRARVISDHLPLLYVPKVRADPRFKAATAGWSGCMRRAGLSYADPRQLRKSLPKLTAGLSAAKAAAAEIRLAVAEATCARRTPLSSVVRDLDRHYGDIVRTQYRAEVQARNRLQLAALPRAQQIVREWKGSR